MYALVEVKGKQYKAEKDKFLIVDELDAEKDSVLEIHEVLMTSDGDNVQVGSPYVNDAVVTLRVEESFRDKKVIVFKYKSKKDYHRTIGHRQHYTKVRVEGISVK